MSAIKPGIHVDLILNSDYQSSNSRMFKATVYDVLDRKIIISQCVPPLTDGHLGKTFVVTYCVREGGQTERYGCLAKVTNFTQDYEIASREQVETLVLERKSEPEQMNVRLSFRIRPTLDSSLSLYHRGSKLNLIDISLGGAQFSYDAVPSPKPNDTIRLKLKIDQNAFEVDARVVRSWLSSLAGWNRKINCVAVSFPTGNRNMERLLSNKIMMIERQRLAEGKMRR